MSYSPAERDWVTEELSALRRDFLLGELTPLLTAAGFGGCIAVEARQAPVVLEAFGSERLMIGSNWPVCTVAGGYPRAVDASLGLLEQLSVDERGAILGRTCQRWYGFGDGGRPADDGT